MEENGKNTSTAPTVPIEKKSLLSNLFSGKKKLIIIGLAVLIVLLGLTIWYLNNRNNLSKEELAFTEAMTKSDFAAAQKSAQQALEKSPDNKYMLAGIINSYAQQGNQTGQESKSFEEAQTYVKKALEVAPDDPSVLISIGYLNETAGKYEEALSYYNKAIEKDPNNSGAYFHKGHVLAFLNKNQESVEAYNKSYELDPNNPLTQVVMGNKLQSEGKLDEALSLFIKAAENENSNWSSRAEAYTAAAFLANRMGNYDDSMKYAEQAVRFDQNYSIGYAIYGVNLARRGKTQDAFKSMTRAITLNQRISNNYVLLGALLRSVGSYDDALKSLQVALDKVDNDNTLVGTAAKEQMKAGIKLEITKTEQMQAAS